MNQFILSCCSTADLSREHFQKIGVHYICFHYSLDGKEYPDDLGVSIPFSEFYAKMAAGAPTSTSQVNVEEYYNYFETFLKDGFDILHVTLSSGISGSLNSACTARDLLKEKYPGQRVCIVDSLGASSGFGLLMDTLAEKKAAGMDLDSLYSWVQKNRLRVHHWFFSTERLIPRYKIRTKKKVIRTIVDKMEEHAEGGKNYSGKCYISQSACIEDARQVARLVEERFPNLNGRVEINDIGTTIGSHTGPGTVALFFWGDERR